MKKHSIGTLVALTATALLSGCALYFGDEKNGGDNWNYCGSDGYYSCDGDNCQWVSASCPEPGQGSAGQPGEFECRDNADCAAGCYCGEAGVCEEAGFCAQDSDCGEGYECNEERSSCEPVSCTCTTDAQATAGGYDYCDETTQTCETGTDPEGTCAGEPTCNQVAPTCPSGQVPTIVDGCWSGLCSPVAACEAPPACGHINDEASCSARTDCAATVNGINCTKPDGSACMVGDSNCSCEQLVFAACRAGTSP
jgi:hypothetical protein